MHVYDRRLSGATRCKQLAELDTSQKALQFAQEPAAERTCSFILSPNTDVAASINASMRVAMEHLLAKYREMRPLLRCLARPMKEEWKMSPYLGVLPFVFSALNSAFSAPRIWTVDAGAFARFVRDPAFRQSVKKLRVLVAQSSHDSLPA